MEMRFRALLKDMHSRNAYIIMASAALLIGVQESGRKMDLHACGVISRFWDRLFKGCPLMIPLVSRTRCIR